MNKGTVKTPLCAECGKSLRWKTMDSEPKLVCRHCGESYETMKATGKQHDCDNRQACHAEITRIFRVELQQALREATNHAIPNQPLPPVVVDFERAKRAALEAREKSGLRRLSREAKKSPQMSMKADLKDHAHHRLQSRSERIPCGSDSRSD